MPGDGLPLAVFIRGQQQGIGALEQLTQLGDLRLFAGGDDVEWGKVFVDIHPQAGPGLATDGGRDLTGIGR